MESKGEELGRKIQRTGCAVTAGCLGLGLLALLVMWAAAFVRG